MSTRAPRRPRRRRDRGRVADVMLGAETVIWLGRRLWRPLAAELVPNRRERRAARRPRRRR